MALYRHQRSRCRAVQQDEDLAGDQLVIQHIGVRELRGEPGLEALLVGGPGPDRRMTGRAGQLRRGAQESAATPPRGGGRAGEGVEQASDLILHTTAALAEPALVEGEGRLVLGLKIGTGPMACMVCRSAGAGALPSALELSGIAIAIFAVWLSVRRLQGLKV